MSALPPSIDPICTAAYAIENNIPREPNSVLGIIKNRDKKCATRANSNKSDVAKFILSSLLKKPIIFGVIPIFYKKLTINCFFFLSLGNHMRVAGILAASLFIGSSLMHLGMLLRFPLFEKEIAYQQGLQCFAIALFFVFGKYGAVFFQAFLLKLFLH